MQKNDLVIKTLNQYNTFCIHKGQEETGKSK